MKCPHCSFESDKEAGIKRHMTIAHGGYRIQELQEMGMTPTRSDHARSLDSGRTSISETVSQAPEGETTDEQKGTRVPRQSKANRAQAEAEAEFNRVRPILINKWKRRLRIPYSLWARLANDPDIALSESELVEGAEMHVELMQAMSWLHAGKIEAVADLILWHGGTILSRSELGKNLIRSFDMEPKQEKPN